MTYKTETPEQEQPAPTPKAKYQAGVGEPIVIYDRRGKRVGPLTLLVIAIVAGIVVSWVTQVYTGHDAQPRKSVAVRNARRPRNHRAG